MNKTNNIVVACLKDNNNQTKTHQVAAAVVIFGRNALGTELVDTFVAVLACGVRRGADITRSSPRGGGGEAARFVSLAVILGELGASVRNAVVCARARRGSSLPPNTHAHTHTHTYSITITITITANMCTYALTGPRAAVRNGVPCSDCGCVVDGGVGCTVA